MTSIRKTKKRLKRELAEARKAFAECGCNTVRGVFLADALQKDIARIEGKLERLKILKFASRRGTKKRLAYGVLCSLAMWKREEKLNALSRGKVCEMITGKTFSLSELASRVHTKD